MLLNEVGYSVYTTVKMFLKELLMAKYKYIQKL